MIGAGKIIRPDMVRYMVWNFIPINVKILKFHTAVPVPANVKVHTSKHLKYT